MKASYKLLLAVGLLDTQALAAPPRAISKRTPALWKREGDPALDIDFPDPSILQDSDGTWYAFATAGNDKQVQVAQAPSALGPWTYLEQDLLPDGGPWTTSQNTWAPDVHLLDDGTYIMYYSGEVANNTAFHCIGVATSASGVLGPYTPQDAPFDCDLSVGGSIDASGFRDDDDTRYVAYKIDGNSIGHGGSCGNDVAPQVPTPIRLQRVAQDGFTKIGAVVTILDRTAADGPLVEAPTLLRRNISNINSNNNNNNGTGGINSTDNGTYVLFFSSGCYTEPTYNVNYATASSVTGPYTRSVAPLVSSDDAFGLMAPGGATPRVDGSGIVFHADCDQGRCMYVSRIGIRGLDVMLDGVDGIGMST